MKNKSIESKIKSYSALSAGLLAVGGTVQGQINYVDVVPDSITNFSGGTTEYNLDLNDDSFVDFVLEIVLNSATFYIVKNDLTTISPISNNEVLCDGGTSLPKLLNINDSIDPANNEWKDKSTTLVMNYFKTTYSYGVGLFNTSSGNWQGGIYDKYLGLTMEVSGKSCYGWVRLDVGENDGNDRPAFTVKEYAIQQFPGVPIVASSALNVASSAASSLVVSDFANNGNGSDLQVSFNKAINEAKVKEYHLIAIKSANAATYTDSIALLSVLAGNSTAVAKTGSNVTASFASDAKDTDGDPIVENVAYKVFVVSAPDGYTSTSLAMSTASDEVTLTVPAPLLSDAVANLVISDVADNNNGSDMQVAFDKAADESKVDSYRVIVVKTADAATFTVDLANAVAAGSYTSVAKTGSNISTILATDAKDKDGVAIADDIAYKVFVLSVADGTNANTNVLSTVSSEITLVVSPPVLSDAISNLVISDVADNNNGSDMQVAFDKAADESKVDSYRVIVVKTADVATFTVDLANAVVAGNYTAVAKTGVNMSTALASDAKDKDGAVIANDIAYKVFVLSVADGMNANTNVLSTASNEITLLSALLTSDPASNVVINDIADNSNGSDMQVAFDKAADESKVDSYRVIVVKTADAATFTVDLANGVAAGSYTSVAKTGSNISTILATDAKDKEGVAIANDIAYKVFVLSVADGTNANTNVLSTVSSEITLVVSPPVLSDAISNLVISDVADNNNGSDMQVAFDKAADESKVDSYRVIVVKTADVATFSVDLANAVVAGNYTAVAKTGVNMSTALASDAKDKDGAVIANDIAYKVFVLSVADGTNANTNALSTASAELSLYTAMAAGEATNLAATDIANNSNGSDLQIAFDKAADETTIDEYRVIVVKTADAATFDLNAADAVLSGNYTAVSKMGSNISIALATDAKDKDGDAITVQTAYKVFVLSIADGTNANINKLSSASAELTLISVFYSDAATNVQAGDIANNGNGSDLQVSFDKATDEAKVNEYRVIVVKTADAATFDLNAADAVLSGNYTAVAKTGSNIQTILASDAKDKDGLTIAESIAYKVFVLSVADGTNANANTLSTASTEIMLTPAIYAGTITNIQLSDIADNQNGSDLQVNFDKASDESTVSEYRIIVIKTADAAAFDLSAAESVISGNYTAVNKTGSNLQTVLSSTAKDKDGAAIANDIAYKVFVLSIADGTNANANTLSTASSELSLTTKVYASAATNPSMSDIADNQNGSDLQVSFDKASDETTVSEYRIIVVKTADAAAFGLSAAESVVSGNYTAVSKTGSNIQTVLSSTAKDKDGAAIADNVAYKAFVLSVADGTNANTNTLSTASSELTLTSILYTDAVTNIVLSDIDDNSNGSDLHVEFDKASDETKVGEYRIIVMKSADAVAFDLNAAESVTSGNYTMVSKTGSNISATLATTAKDKDGNAIIVGVSYKAFVLSVADGTNANANVLSAVSTEVTLNSIHYSEAASNILLQDVAENGNGSDLRVLFDKASDETKVSEYRIIVIKSADAVSFNISVAESVVSANYTTVSKTGSNLSTLLASTAKDKDGNAIANGVAYKAFVLSLADSVNANTNVLSTASAEITLASLVSAEGIDSLMISDIANNENASDIQVTFDIAANEATIDHYRVFVVKSDTSSSFKLATANSLYSSHYTMLVKSNSDVKMTLSSTVVDTDGDAIANNIAYRVFVLSVADGAIAKKNTLSDPSDELTLIYNTSINEIDDNGISIYQNDNNLHINFSDNSSFVGSELMIYDITGRAVETRHASSLNNTISLQEFTRGMYVVRVINNKKIYSKKIILR